MVHSSLTTQCILEYEILSTVYTDIYILYNYLISYKDVSQVLFGLHAENVILGLHNRQCMYCNVLNAALEAAEV